MPIPKCIEGDDLSGTVRDPKFAEDRVALYEGVAPFANLEIPANKREYRAIRTSRYTYVRDLKGPWLLYDDDSDPFQMNNLANKPETAGLQKELEAKLHAELNKGGDVFRDGQYYIDLWGYDVKKATAFPTSRARRCSRRNDKRRRSEYRTTNDVGDNQPVGRSVQTTLSDENSRLFVHATA